MFLRTPRLFVFGKLEENYWLFKNKFDGTFKLIRKPMTEDQAKNYAGKQYDIVLRSRDPISIYDKCNNGVLTLRLFEGDSNGLSKESDI